MKAFWVSIKTYEYVPFYAMVAGYFWINLAGSFFGFASMLPKGREASAVQVPLYNYRSLNSLCRCVDRIDGRLCKKAR